MERKFVNDCNGKFKVAMKESRTGGKTVRYLLWGDPVRVHSTSGGMAAVEARGRPGFIPADHVTDTSLLEIYVIDVGQGDGILIRTPNDRWHAIDAGNDHTKQMTKKNAANFIRWKFKEDLGLRKVRLENVILSHPDRDHYGGLIDLFQGKVYHPEREFDIEVENFYHPGIGRFAAAPLLGQAIDGTVPEPPFDDYGVSGTDTFITELLAAKNSFQSPTRPFEETFATFADLVGRVPAKVRRLTHRDEYVPGYAPGDNSVVMRVLGPILERVNGHDALRVLGSESVTRNGHSIVLRLEYGKARILLTGDLNTASQRLLLSYHGLEEFPVDVAKACHHGSDDIDLRFVRAMKARVTILSSGDNEDYAHPRPRVLGASARYGREAKAASGELLPPLLYSTELARSVRLREAAKVRDTKPPGVEIDAKNAEVKPQGRGTAFEPLEDTPIATDLVYGLINVRTDGTTIMCAYMEEAGPNFDVRVLRAGVEPDI